MGNRSITKKLQKRHEKVIYHLLYYRHNCRGAANTVDFVAGSRDTGLHGLSVISHLCQQASLRPVEDLNAGAAGGIAARPAGYLYPERTTAEQGRRAGYRSEKTCDGGNEPRDP